VLRARLDKATTTAQLLELLGDIEAVLADLPF